MQESLGFEKGGGFWVWDTSQIWIVKRMGTVSLGLIFLISRLPMSYVLTSG